METMENNSRKPIYQLRVYEIFEHNKEPFLVRFRDHAARIMRKHQFNIVRMWETEINGRQEFVYLLEWENETELKKQWAEFMADKEWQEIRERTTVLHGNMVGRIEDRVLKEVF